MSLTIPPSHPQSIVPVDVQCTDIDTSTSALSAYTFTSMNFGDPDADRKIVVGFSYEHIGTCQDALSITVAGQNASSVVFKYDGRYDASMLWVVDLPTGIAGNVVVTLPITAIRCVCFLLAMYGADTSAFDTATSSAQPPSVSLDIPDNGVAIGIYGGNVKSGLSDETWAELIKESSATLDGALTSSVASKEYDVGGTKTISAWPGDTNGNNLVAASWPPA